MADEKKIITDAEAGEITAMTGLHEGYPGPNPRVEVSQGDGGACKVIVHSDNAATNTYSRDAKGNLLVEKESIPSKFVDTLDENGSTFQGRSPQDTGYKELQTYSFNKNGTSDYAYSLTQKGKSGIINDQDLAAKGLSAQELSFMDPEYSKNEQTLKDTKKEAQNVLAAGCKPIPMM